MLEPLSYPFFQRALLAGLLASVACGIVGTYVVVKRIASLSGGLSHAAFGGVGLGYLAGFDPIVGATGFALGGSLLLSAAYRKLGTHLDTLISMLWAAGMALGILFIALTPGYAPDLMTYLFGSILFVSPGYVWVVLALDIVIAGVVMLLFKELRAVAFDEEFAEVMGIPVGLVFASLLALVSLAVVTLIRVVGVILVIALLTIPATIARQWAHSLGRTMLLAIFLGAVFTTAGLYTSYYLSELYDVNAPTGPVIILLAMIAFGISSALRRRSTATVPAEP